MDDSKYSELEERIKALEEKLNSISFNGAKEIKMQNCLVTDIQTGNDCRLEFEKCAVGAVIDSNIDDAEDRLDELECRLDDINAAINEAESKLD